MYKKEEIYIWTMRDGTDIRVEDMTLQHVTNLLKMFERNSGYTIKFTEYSHASLINVLKRTDRLNKLRRDLDEQCIKHHGMTVQEAEYYHDNHLDYDYFH